MGLPMQSRGPQLKGMYAPGGRSVAVPCTLLPCRASRQFGICTPACQQHMDETVLVLPVHSVALRHKGLPLGAECREPDLGLSLA